MYEVIEKSINIVDMCGGNFGRPCILHGRMDIWAILLGLLVCCVSRVDLLGSKALMFFCPPHSHIENKYNDPWT